VGDRFSEALGADGVTTAGAYAWPASQAVAASLAMAQLSGRGPAYRADLRSGIVALERYWQPGSLGGYSSQALGGADTGAEFYDDNEWIALDLLGAYRVTGDRDALARARELFELVASGWGADASSCPGGVYWMRSGVNRDRNAVTTVNGAVLALQLHQLTGGRQYLRWARRMLSWSERCLTRADGLLADHIAADGSRDERAWSYNQGAFVAASVLLARATGDQRYLDRAERRAATALAEYGSFAGEPRIFVAIFFRYLALLDAVRPRPEYRRALVAYADTAWQSGRDRTTGLFGDRDGPTLLDQAAMVQIYALLAGRT
jgi:hypothetical protein